MKKVLLTLVFISAISLQSCATYTPVEMHPIDHQFELNKKKDVLFVSANNWMVETFNNASSVIQFTDKESGTVTGKYLLKDTYAFSGATATPVGIYAIIKIQVKDGASKITITPDNFQEITSSLVNENFRYGKPQADAQIQGLIASFEAYVKNDNSNEW